MRHKKSWLQIPRQIYIYRDIYIHRSVFWVCFEEYLGSYDPPPYSNYPFLFNFQTMWRCSPPTVPKHCTDTWLRNVPAWVGPMKGLHKEDSPKSGLACSRSLSQNENCENRLKSTKIIKFLSKTMNLNKT